VPDCPTYDDGWVKSLNPVAGHQHNLSAASRTRRDLTLPTHDDRERAGQLHADTQLLVSGASTSRCPCQAVSEDRRDGPRMRRQSCDWHGAILFALDALFVAFAILRLFRCHLVLADLMYSGSSGPRTTAHTRLTSPQRARTACLPAIPSCAACCTSLLERDQRA